MAAIDELSTRLFEQAKRFLEKAKLATDDDGHGAYLNAALLLGFSAMEAHINAVCDELTLRKGLEIVEQSLLLEREFVLEKGEFKLTSRLKMYRLEDRLAYIFKKFGGKSTSTLPWWGRLKEAIRLRNGLVHPKEPVVIDEKTVARALETILDCLDDLYQAAYRRRYPGRNRRLNSTLDF